MVFQSIVIEIVARSIQFHFGHLQIHRSFFMFLSIDYPSYEYLALLATLWLERS